MVSTSETVVEVAPVRYPVCEVIVRPSPSVIVVAQCVLVVAVVV
jgi:hypothetical protein